MVRLDDFKGLFQPQWLYDSVPDLPLALPLFKALLTQGVWSTVMVWNPQRKSNHFCPPCLTWQLLRHQLNGLSLGLKRSEKGFLPVWGMIRIHGTVQICPSVSPDAESAVLWGRRAMYPFVTSTFSSPTCWLSFGSTMHSRATSGRVLLAQDPPYSDPNL